MSGLWQRERRCVWWGIREHFLMKRKIHQTTFFLLSPFLSCDISLGPSSPRPPPPILEEEPPLPPLLSSVLLSFVLVHVIAHLLCLHCVRAFSALQPPPRQWVQAATRAPWPSAATPPCLHPSRSTPTSSSTTTGLLRPTPGHRGAEWEPCRLVGASKDGEIHSDGLFPTFPCSCLCAQVKNTS